MTIIVNPEQISQFASPEGASFCLVTNPELMDRFEIRETGDYSDYRKLAYTQEGEIRRLLEEEIPEHAHVLAISPLVFFRSPEQEWIGPRRKLMAMACNSTPTPVEAVAHFLKTVEATDAREQDAFADRLFDRLESVTTVEIVDPVAGTRAVFDHFAAEYTWNQQAGTIDWGEQQIAPAGEISVLPADIWDFSEGAGLAINGELAFRGLPILHSGEPSFLRDDQERIWRALRTMDEHAVIATVENGFVTAVRPAHPDAEPASRMLDTMFAVDSRYRMIEEIGFAINTALKLLPGNYAMNEVFGGSDGVIHFGLGLTPYTQYHLDIISPDTRVVSEKGMVHGTPIRAAAA